MKIQGLTFFATTLGIWKQTEGSGSGNERGCREWAEIAEYVGSCAGGRK